MKIGNLTLTGSEQTFVVPLKTSSIAFHANGGDFTIAVASSGSVWTVRNGQKESIDVSALQGSTLYITGTGVMEYRYFDTVL